MMEGLAMLRGVDLGEVLTSVLDVLLVSFIIYRILLLIKNTRAVYTLLGLVVVGGIFIAAQRLSLTTLTWLLDHVISYAILIVAIVFQADIRRGLMRMGRRMFRRSKGSEDTQVIEEVVAACGTMAEKRIGAIIVFEGEHALDELVEPGTPLDALVSQALLINIFTAWPDNLLHDGAVVVKDNLLQQAAAVLPLSRNPGLDKALGTRHRAAVGITEDTDALAVVVSEQRGSIGLCRGGMLTKELPPGILRSELLALLTVEEPTAWRRAERVLRRLEELLSINKARRDARSGAAAEPGERGPEKEDLS